MNPWRLKVAMFGSAIVYSGLAMLAAGCVLAVKPIRRCRIATRRNALGLAGGGVLLVGIGLVVPAAESRATIPGTRLDQFVPAWQFRERHTRDIAASPARVFEAIERVRADEISLFRTLIWIRRGGKPLPYSVRRGESRDGSLIDVALRTTFVRLARDVPRELVIGTVVGAPPGWRGRPTQELFASPVPPGFVLAAMDFIVTPDASGGSVVSTETRVFASSPAARRRFAAYWRLIYPGSALIRRNWLASIERRATRPIEP